MSALALALAFSFFGFAVAVAERLAGMAREKPANELHVQSYSSQKGLRRNVDRWRRNEDFDNTEAQERH